MDNITALGSDVYEIDTRMAGYSGITAGYLILGDRPAWWRPVPPPPRRWYATRWPRWASGPRTWPRSWSRTSIWTTRAASATSPSSSRTREIVVHEKGARHLADPSRLMASARMVWGDALDTLFGELSPTEAARIRALDDTGAIDLGNGRTLRATTRPATPSTTSA